MAVLRRSLLLIAIVCIVAPVAAGAAPHTRLGLCAGLGFGVESVSWTDADGARDAESSGTANARIGYAVKSDLVLGVEFWGWAKEYEVLTSSGTVDIDVQLTATTLAVTYYPGNAGFFLRLGAGLAYSRVDLNVPAGVDPPANGSGTEAGVAVLFAPGYEFRLTRTLALGAQGDVVYMGLSDVIENPFGYGLNVQFNWYW